MASRKSKEKGEVSSSGQACGWAYDRRKFVSREALDRFTNTFSNRTIILKQD